MYIYSVHEIFSCVMRHIPAGGVQHSILSRPCRNSLCRRRAMAKIKLGPEDVALIMDEFLMEKTEVRVP